MNSTEKYKYAIKLLKDLNCPEDIMALLEIWGWCVDSDAIKLENWRALSDGQLVEGEGREIPTELGSSLKDRE